MARVDKPNELGMDALARPPGESLPVELAPTLPSLPKLQQLCAVGQADEVLSIKSEGCMSPDMARVDKPNELGVDATARPPGLPMQESTFTAAVSDGQWECDMCNQDIVAGLPLFMTDSDYAVCRDCATRMQLAPGTADMYDLWRRSESDEADELYKSESGSGSSSATGSDLLYGNDVVSAASPEAGELARSVNWADDTEIEQQARTASTPQWLAVPSPWAPFREGAFLNPFVMKVMLPNGDILGLDEFQLQYPPQGQPEEHLHLGGQAGGDQDPEGRSHLLPFPRLQGRQENSGPSHARVGEEVIQEARRLRGEPHNPGQELPARDDG